MTVLPPLVLAPTLQSVPDLAAHDIAAAQLATNGIGPEGEPSGYRSDHLGRIVAVRQGGAIIAGPLLAVNDSVHPPLLVLRIGQFTTAVHPTHPVTVAPHDHQLTVTAHPKPVQQHNAARDGGR